MAKIRKHKQKRKQKEMAIPNYGLVRVLDSKLQKQLEDLNEMKKAKSGLSEDGTEGNNKS